MRPFGRIFFRGLITILPLAITIYILYSAVIIIDSLLGVVLIRVLPTYTPGLGFIAILFLIFIFGLLLNNLVIGRFLAIIEQRLLEVPLIRAVYSPLKDLLNLFSKENQKNLQQVVFVKLSDQGPVAMGLMTRENFDELKLGEITQGKVAVYFPFSYGLGGYTVLVNRESIIPSTLPIEKAMSLAITGWVKAEQPKP